MKLLTKEILEIIGNKGFWTEDEKGKIILILEEKELKELPEEITEVIKKRVEQLLEEIEKKKEKLNNFLESRPKNLKGKEYLEWVGDLFQAYNLIEILSWFENLIKKYFKEVKPNA